MADTILSARTSVPRLPSWVRQTALGLLYWLVFLLVLEPDNVMKAPHLQWSLEVMRIAAAGLLGASITPILVALVRHNPAKGIARMAVEAFSCAVLAAILIAVSCLLADWLLASEHRPLGTALAEEFEGNWTLVTFAVGALLAVVHALQSFDRKPAVPPAKPAYLTGVRAKSRGGVAFIDLAEVDWIETQGNYLALHTAGAVHLVRDSLAEFERKLDPARFARIHRRTVVAVDRIGKLRSLGAGDAVVTLKDGTELRVSRGFRARRPDIFQA